MLKVAKVFVSVLRSGLRPDWHGAQVRVSAGTSGGPSVNGAVDTGRGRQGKVLVSVTEELETRT